MKLVEFQPLLFPSHDRGGGGDGNRSGANGGSGVVILRYPKGYTLNADPGHTVSTTAVGTQQVSTFTAGSGNITFTV